MVGPEYLDVNPRLLHLPPSRKPIRRILFASSYRLRRAGRPTSSVGCCVTIGRPSPRRLQNVQLIAGRDIIWRCILEMGFAGWHELSARHPQIDRLGDGMGDVLGYRAGVNG